MMRKLLCAALVFILLLTALPSVLAANSRVIDEADLLTSEETRKLDDIAENLANTYGIDAVIVTVRDLGGKSLQAYADDFFDYNGCGMGDDDSGVLLLISMAERDWYVSTHAQGTEAVTYDDIGDLEEEMVPYLSDGDYYGGFAAYLQFLESEFDYYRTYESGITFKGFAVRLVIALVIGAVIALIALLVMRSCMNTAKPQQGASHYMKKDTYELYRCHDIFLYSRTTKTAKAQSSGSGGTHRSSSGRSHGGRGGKF